MHNYLITKGTTDVSVELRIVDSTDGTPETGVVWNTAGIDLQYRRDGAASTAITEATLAALTTAHTDGGFLHIGIGVFRFDLPDAACASGVDKVIVHGTVTGMVVIGCVIQLTDVDIFDGVRAGMTALPNAAADAAGGLPISDAGGLDLDGMNTNINDIETDTNELQGDWANGGRLDLILDSRMAEASINTTAGAVDNVTLVATTTTNTDMRGTDSAATAAALATAQTDLDTITGTNGVLIDDTEAAALVDDVWDEVLTGGAHNVTNSAGRRLRSIQEFQGYEGGHVWIDGVNGTAGTVSYENGTVENPVDAPAGSIADANTIAAAVSLSRFSVAPATSITFAASQANQIFEGHEWTVALGGQAVTASMFIDASVSGTGTGAESEWEQCIFGVTSLPAMQAYDCSFTATASGGFTMSAAGDYRFINCQSGVAGSGSPLFTSGAGAHTAEFRRWSGGITFAGLTSSDTITVGGEMGTIDLGSPASAAVIEVRGTYKAITNIGSATVNTDGAILASDVADTLADTNELQTNQGNWLTATGFATEAKQDIIDANVDAVLLDTNELQTDDVPGLISALNNISAAQVNAEVLDVIQTDTFAELAGVPAATSSLKDKLTWVFMLARNQIEQTATTTTVRADDTTTAVATSTVSDDATTATRGEMT